MHSMSCANARVSKQACRVIVDLLALAHERTCERELAQAIEGISTPGACPIPRHCSNASNRMLQACRRVNVELVPLSAYDELAAVHDIHHGAAA